MAKREEGYYWVKVKGRWLIMLWDTCHKEWYDGCIPFSDKELDEIEEVRLEHEEKAL